MDRAQQLLQTRMRFESELERALGANYLGMPRPLEQLVDAIECEPPLADHFSQAAEKLVPESFDAKLEVERVRADEAAVFGPFEGSQTANAAQAFLVVQELVRRRTKFHDPVFSGYANTKRNPKDHVSPFVEEVVMLVVDEARGHLQALMEAAGVEAPEAARGGAGESQDEGAAARDIAKPCTAQLQDLLENLHEATAGLAADDREDALLQIDALQDELLCAEPKERVVRALLRVLRSFDGGEELEGALDRLVRAI